MGLRRAQIGPDPLPELATSYIEGLRAVQVEALAEVHDLRRIQDRGGRGLIGDDHLHLVRRRSIARVVHDHEPETLAAERGRGLAAETVTSTTG